jgi:proteasome lid subunit RPN8/RPN11
MLFIYDSVLEQIKADIGDKAPERGGALLGEPCKPIITKFIFDSQAFTTSSTYSPSRKLNKSVQEAEEKEGLEYKGLIHSHPGEYDQPSSQDIAELATGLRLNKHMPFYLVPIVTTNSEKEMLEPHELKISEMKISFFAGYPAKNKEETLFSRNIDEVSLQAMEVKKIPEGLLTRDLESLCKEKRGLHLPEVFVIDFEDEPMLAGKIEVEDLFELLLLVNISYPFGQPRVLVTHIDGKQEELIPDWSGEGTFMAKLDRFISHMIDKSTNKMLAAEKPQSKGKVSHAIRVNITEKNMELKGDK